MVSLFVCCSTLRYFEFKFHFHTRQEAAALKRNGLEASSNSWWRKISMTGSSPRPTPVIHENIPQLRQDISALEEFGRQLFMEIHDMQNMRERIEWSKTFQGKYFNFLGYFFSLYCTWKIFISTVNIVFDRVGRLDPISKGSNISQIHISKA